MAYDQQPPKKTGLLQLLRESIGTQFVIPVYQRNYTWTANKEVKQYLEDLESVLKGKYSKHFLGILIYLDTPLDYSSREFSIIDGQQRITTTFLILYALKHLMIEKNEPTEAQKIDNIYLINQFSNDNLKFKLKPLVSDDEVYQQIVNNDIKSITNKNSNIFKNFEYIKSYFNKLLETYTFNDILMSLDKLYVVCVPVISDDSPQKIFESINSTGAKLSASDLIRNYVLMDMTSETQEKLYKIYWKKIEDYIGSDAKKIEAFFRFFLAVKQKSLSNQNAIYSNFKIWFNGERDDNSIEDILKEVVSYSRAYNVIYLKPINEVDLKIRESIKEFRSNLSDMPAPFLMEIYSLYTSDDEEGNPLITAEQFNEILNVLNCYLVRRAICGLDTSDITRLFPTLLKDVLRDCGKSFSKIVDYTKKNLVNKNRGKAAYMPDDEQLKNLVRYSNVYNLKITLRVIFDKLETKGNSAPVDLSRLSIEHLMPQTPTKEWLTYLNIDDVTYENNLHRLGNLTLATKVDNSKMKNKPWDFKKEVLADTSHLIMNQKILKKSEWKIKEINERTEELLDDIIKLYPYQSASDDVIAKHDLFLESSGVTALGVLYEEDGSVEVLDGSEIVKYSEDNSASEGQIDTYNRLLEEGVIKETDKGAVFVKSYLFMPSRNNDTALSLTAGIILGGSRNGWEYWKDSSGQELQFDKELKKKLKGKN